ncbi:MFS transporter [Pseudonocardia xishanensis]|uniref:MFS transporter n=1 Tax=Pseudonocardia xishanensis TaxID=630995 RepID=A0ABP8S1X4_9PSEU
MTFTNPAPGDEDRATDAAPAHSGRLSRRAILAATIGTATEFYDVTVYAYLTTVIAVVFFPAGDPAAALLAALAAFAASFLVRPLGGILFGWIGDTLGRRKALVIALLGMAVATFAIGVLPTYAAFGLAATVLLMVARIAQGISAGGEIGGAAAYLAEQAPPARRGLVTCLVNVGVLIGTLSASLAVAVLVGVLTQEQMLAWGWRLPFLIALPLGVIGLYIRRRLEDTAQFEAARAAGEVPRIPLVALLRDHRKALAQGFVVSALTYGGFYTVFSYTQIHLVQVTEHSARIASLSTTVGLAVGLVLLPLFGLLGDRLGRKPVLGAAVVLLAVLPWPMFTLFESGSAVAAVLATVALGVPIIMIQAVNLSVLCELFPTMVRYSGLSLAFNLAAVAFGGTTPLLCTALIRLTGSPTAPALYLIGLALVCAPAVLTMKETARVPLD